jgi:hypothetical protein
LGSPFRCHPHSAGDTGLSETTNDTHRTEHKSSGLASCAISSLSAHHKASHLRDIVRVNVASRCTRVLVISTSCAIFSEVSSRDPAKSANGWPRTRLEGSAIPSWIVPAWGQRMEIVKIIDVEEKPELSTGNSQSASYPIPGARGKSGIKN